MAKNTPVLTYRGKQQVETAIIYILVIAVILILANNWDIPSWAEYKSYVNRTTKTFEDIADIGWWFLNAGKQIAIFLPAFIFCSWSFKRAHQAKFGRKAEPSLGWKVMTYVCYLALLYFFTL